MRQLRFASFQVKELETSKAFYVSKLGFEIEDSKNPEACLFKSNKGEAMFAIRKPLSNLDNKELGMGISLWFATDEKIEKLYAKLVEKEVVVLGGINETPFGKTIIVEDPDGYKLTFLESKN
ncbi:MAG: glyoxalase [Cytophagaceae bacterium]|jgi:catechol 2,3-dioxygenase-like lactoylglutathione lyase family enzyme|nr:glyoxalase [Cytophagaceae bacterium]